MCMYVARRRAFHPEKELRTPIICVLTDPPQGPMPKCARTLLSSLTNVLNGLKGAGVRRRGFKIGARAPVGAARKLKVNLSKNANVET